MDLSIVIVNYNVKHFIEQCLHSVEKAIQNIRAEIFVVDNNSVDGSNAMIKEKFPSVILIENQQNLGFSKANNQALTQAKGRYCLLLNPDTIVEEDSFVKCIQYMDNHPGVGALGVHMIDGRGKFLPESKRSLPTPLVSFFKIFGLSALFPKSRLFGRYHLGFLPEYEINEVEVLSGAYMFLRKDAIRKTGLLDETFFMYGEDVDLSYRINQAGYKIIYYPETNIIHYKGESTKKGSINYVLVFYKAMIIFARKHFSRKNARVFSFLINLAIYFRATLSIIKRFVNRVYQPALDAALIFLGYYFLTPFWEQFKFGIPNYYPNEFIQYIVPVYIGVWLLSLYYSGAYEKPIKLWNLLKGHITGTLIILILYALLPESLRFSRALILLGSAWVLIILLFHRMSFNLLGVKDYQFYANRKKRQIIVGSLEEAGRVSSVLNRTRIRPEIIGTVSPGAPVGSEYLGSLDKLPEILKVYKIDEVVFCAKDISSAEIIKNMTHLSQTGIEYKIAPPESLYIIGSNSIHTSGELYLIHFNSVSRGKNRRLKRLFDILAAFFILILFPVLPLFIRNYGKIFLKALKVLGGKFTWISYCPGVDNSALPFLKKGIFSPCDAMDVEIPTGIAEGINLDYARDYKMLTDFILLWKNILGLKRNAN